MPVDDMEMLRGQILLPKAQQAYFSNQTIRAIDLCQQVLTLLPASWTFVRGGSMLYGHVHAGQRSGTGGRTVVARCVRDLQR